MANLTKMAFSDFRFASKRLQDQFVPLCGSLPTNAQMAFDEEGPIELALGRSVSVCVCIPMWRVGRHEADPNLQGLRQFDIR